MRFFQGITDDQSGNMPLLPPPIPHAVEVQENHTRGLLLNAEVLTYHARADVIHGIRHIVRTLETRQIAV